MSAGSSREAVEEGIRLVRERASLRAHSTDLSRFAELMSLETTEAILLRAADLRDHGVSFANAGGPVSYALANALAGFLLTATQGDAEAAARALPAAIRGIEQIARVACANPQKGVITTVGKPLDAGGAQ